MTVGGDFDRYSEDYAEVVQQSIDFAGQDVAFFTEVKARVLLQAARRHLGSCAELALLDVGCGVGLTESFLVEHCGEVHGVDVSADSIRRARENHPRAFFKAFDGRHLPFEDQRFDLVFAINVMHHVQPAERDPLIAEMARTLRPGGLAAILEHNPWNPLTRRAVSRCPFDEDAILLRRRESRRRLQRAGLECVESRYILFFPWRGDRWRRIEARLGALPLGAQHMVAARRC
ncbi:MAG: class I SAM-dependent methyltransferase [Acidobacteriota bacterium]|nr:class I SAM-dependent methyltransferase [Acidobacteriota bacterium]